MIKRNSQIFLLLLLGVLSAFGPFVVDLYLPSLPQLAIFFETSSSMTQLTLSTAMIGLAVGQLLFGPISDKFGRKKPLIISLTIYTTSSVTIIFSPNIETMIFLRIVQGLSSAGSVVISRAIVADLYQGQEMTRFFGLLMVINGLAPIFSPILGSTLLEYMSWKGIFAFLTLIGMVVIIFSLRLHESLSLDRRLQGSTFASFASFSSIIKQRRFMEYVWIESFIFGAMFAYIAASPFILQSSYGLSPFAFSLCFGSNGIALVIGSKNGSRFPEQVALRFGVFGFVCAVCYTVAMLLLQAHWLFVELGFFATLLMIGIPLPAISALAMGSERHHAGAASAILGCAPFLLGGTISPLVGLGDIFISTSLAMATCATMALLIYKRHKKAGI